jgi:hypothetical protein
MLHFGDVEKGGRKERRKDKILLTDGVSSPPKIASQPCELL